MENVKRILIVSTDKKLLEVLNFCFDGWGYEVCLCDYALQDIAFIKKISPDIIIVDVHSASKSHLEICRLIKDDFFTAFIPVITLINKRQLRSQLLHLKQGVDDYLIKPPDPLDLRIRVEMAARRSQYSFYATPLTGLPGGRIIEEVLKEKVKKEAPFSFGYIDIDNFKYFNDVYGYVKGDNVIMHTAYMLYAVIKKFGNSDDFIGHIGGDDFIFITTPNRYKDICENFILIFDRLIPFHYSIEDRNRGFIIARDRTHKINKIPLMSVTLALLNKDEASKLENVIEINERISETKHYLKSIPGSKFMVDRRNRKKDKADSFVPVVYKKEEGLFPYKPLGQILLEKNIITSEQLDEALKIHWRKGIILGEVFKELGMITEKTLIDALRLQESVEVQS
jgi:DNA-binding response OmpR family regulator